MRKQSLSSKTSEDGEISGTHSNVFYTFADESSNDDGSIEFPNDVKEKICLPADVQLPNGCEIYLVKESLPEEHLNIRDSLSSPQEILSSASLDFEFSAEKSAADKEIACTSSDILVQQSFHKKQTAAVATRAKTLTTPNGKNERNFLMEASKKRDDKRRATHNEVERRRRNKINSWIFKLKEMLPNEVPRSNTMTYRCANDISTGGNSVRASPNDSKSQILIKACEYIKSMQDEVNSLQECLLENEHLREQNQRLQDELNEYKNQRNNNSSLQSTNLNAANNTIISRNNMSFFNPSAITTFGQIDTSGAISFGKQFNSSMGDCPQDQARLLSHAAFNLPKLLQNYFETT